MQWQRIDWSQWLHERLFPFSLVPSFFLFFCVAGVGVGGVGGWWGEVGRVLIYFSFLVGGSGWVDGVVSCRDGSGMRRKVVANK